MNTRKWIMMCCAALTMTVLSVWGQTPGQNFTINIAYKTNTHTVTQSAMKPSLSGTTTNIVAVGATGSVGVSIAAGVVWTAKSDTAWIKLVSPTGNVSGPGNVSYEVEPNGTIYPRTGTLTIAGLTYTVIQSGRAHAVDNKEFFFPPDGGMGTANFTTEANATWNAVASAGWISIAEGQSGKGPSGILFIVAPYTNPTTFRTGNITIGTAVIQMTQYGYASSVNPLMQAISPNGGTNSVTVTVPIGAAWEIASRAGWITIVGGYDRTGSGELTYIVAPNLTSGPRSGTILVAGVEVTITQAAGGEPEVNYHPADVNSDSKLVMGEVTAYGSAWKNGTTWTNGPNPIPMAYMTRAGTLWKGGENYTENKELEAPLCWVNTGASLASLAASSPAVSTIAGNWVTIAVTPDASVTVYAAEDAIPVGFTVSEITQSGVFDSVNRKVKWGPWFDNTPRTLSYTLTPPGGFTGTATLVGAVSFDGTDIAITGDRTYGVTTDSAVCTIAGNVVTITITPEASVTVYAAEDAVPVGFSVSGITQSGVFDSVNRKVKWGPYFDNTPRTLSYTLIPPGGFSGKVNLAGEVSFDGTNVSIKGDREYTGGESPEAPELEAAYFGGVLISGTVGVTYVIEYSTNGTTWLVADEITLTAPSMLWSDLSSNGQSKRFYRAAVK